jgi:hypothetical protein
MPLVSCPDCTREHSDAAPACPQCGRPNGAVAVMERAAIPVIPIAPGPRSEVACPQCGSENVRKLSIVFRDGMAVTQTSTGGLIYGGGGAAAIGARSSGTAQSLASVGAAPPLRKRTGGGWIACLVFGILILLAGLGSGSFGSIFFGVVMVGAPVWMIVQTSKWNREVFPGLYAHWDATFQCGRCERRFVPPVRAR